MIEETRLFFVIEGKETNAEIFETLEQAREYRKELKKTDTGIMIKVAIVRNAFRERIGKSWVWNYEDFSDTFDFIKTL
jgi:hypothetical protein